MILWSRGKIKASVAKTITSEGTVVGRILKTEKTDLHCNLIVHKSHDLSSSAFIPNYNIAIAKYGIIPGANSNLLASTNVNKPSDLHSSVFIPYKDRLVAKYGIIPSENSDLPCKVFVSEHSNLQSNVFVSYQDKLTAKYSITSSDYAYLYTTAQILPKGNLPANALITRQTLLRSRYNVKSKVKVSDILYPIKDSYVYDKLPKMNFGSEPTMLSGQGIESLLSFDFDEIPKKNISLVKATLRVYLDGRTDNKIIFHEIGNYWEEQGVTYVNRPSKGEIITEYESRLGQYYIEVDVLDTVKKYVTEGGNGFYITSEDIITMYTREFPQARPRLLIEYYIDAYYKYKDIDLETGVLVRVLDHSYLESHVKVNQYIFYSSLKASVDIVRRDTLNANVSITRNTVPSYTTVVRNEVSKLPSTVEVRGVGMSDIDVSAIITRNSLQAEINIVYRGDNDFQASVGISNGRESSINAFTFVSRPNLGGFLAVRAARYRDLHSIVDISRNDKGFNNFPAKVTVALPTLVVSDNDLLTNLYVHRYPVYANKDFPVSAFIDSIYRIDNLKAKVKILSPYLPANVVIPHKKDEDLRAFLKVRVRRESYLYVNVKVNSGFLYATVDISNTSKSDLFVVSRVLENSSIVGNVTVLSYPNYPYVFIM